MPSVNLQLPHTPHIFSACLGVTNRSDQETNSQELKKPCTTRESAKVFSYCHTKLPWSGFCNFVAIVHRDGLKLALDVEQCIGDVRIEMCSPLLGNHADSLVMRVGRLVDSH
jgi:hypothetical protein